MFVRKKKNKSDVVSIQILEKRNGKSALVKTIGSSNDPDTVEKLFLEGRAEISRLTGQSDLNFDIEKEQTLIDTFFSGIQDFSLVGPELILGKLFDEIGFNSIKDKLFRYLVITRLVYPASKLKTIDYPYFYKGIDLSVDAIYRYLDKIHTYLIRQIQDIGYRHAVKIAGGQISIVFYDVTTLYFEAQDEDDLRRTGYSKDGNHQQPQIVLGLLVNSAGSPLAYEIFEGNTFEGHTMLPIIEAFKKRYGFKELVVVADAGLMSTQNLQSLRDQQYKFIIGARIKNESEAIKKQILALQLKDGKSALLKTRMDSLVISYSEQRAKKDAFNRKRGLEKLEKSLGAGRFTKNNINNKGYNKYLKMKGEILIAIDYEKFKEDASWDGLKGYVTNTTLKKEEVIEQYRQLYAIEKTFRISKTDLQIRPVFHHLRKRIETHICICFAACVIYKELERQLKEKKSTWSAEKAIDIAKTIYRISLVTPYSCER